MTIKSLRFLDFFREFITFSVVLGIFIFGNSAAITTLLWFLCLVSFLAFVAAGINAPEQKIKYTQNKTKFENISLLALCLILVYFGHWFIATLFFISCFLFNSTCLDKDKKDN
ncbi:hypothetical protein BKK51_05580 [Rodentibacter trehalosifermentans]|uniref:Uncharacterized protein n=2 Tax=Rodentibacter trehalosifermentans TaxID=1908263 RepID=A0A1V3IXI0_9PAST|nr:hypothetical protein [Rodentibacter trehalosifermentans]OOF45700.1 hypothetical protein BKK51_05580 [Rodentibacter trehalosifermentans]OOF47014.1 hypothetical protein BKK52_10260 [Rodentibacter trehalosifermentans]